MNYLSFVYLQHNFFWIFPILLLELILKAIALWKAGRNNQAYWFVAVIIFNTAGLLPALYLLFFQCDRNTKKL